MGVRRLTLLFACCLYPCSAAAIQAAETTAEERPRDAGMLDLIPSNATTAVVIRDFDDLQKKGDAFVRKTDINFGIRPSVAMEQIFQWLGVRKGLDRHAPAGVILVNLKAAGIDDLGLDNLNQALVVAVPFADLQQMASNFDLEADELKTGRIVNRKVEPEPFKLNAVFQVRKNHLLMAAHEKAIQAAVGAKAAGTVLTDQERQVLNRCDMLVHLGTTAWGGEWESALERVDKMIGKTDDSPEGRIARRLGEGAGDLQFGLFGVRFDDGLGLTALAVFSEKGPARKVLTRLAGDDSASDLRSLPERENLLAAYALCRDSSHNAAIAGALLEMLLEGFAETRQFVSATRRPVFVGVFGELWQRLEGSRVGVYVNENEQENGLLGMVAVLDTRDPEQFLAETRELATFISAAGQELSEGEAGGVDKERVTRLIEDLGDPNFRVRRTATVKLGLLGEPALPYLEKAAESSDAEVAARARRLRMRIAAAAAARRKDLLGHDLLSRLDPTFVYFAEAEKRAGKTVDIINVRLAEKDEPFREQLKQLFGAEWDRIRVAVSGPHVVVLLGSEPELLEQTIANLRNERHGLAAASSLNEFRNRADEKRKSQIHFSLARAVRLVTPPGPEQLREPKQGSGLSSLCLSFAPTRMRLDAFLPFGEVRVLTRRLR